MARTINSTKRRKDGGKIQTLYYACGSYIIKGASTCEKSLLRKEPVEAVVVELVQKRLRALLEGEAEALLRKLIEEESSANGDDPRREMSAVLARLAEIDRNADALLEGLSPQIRSFVDTKLLDLAVEKRTLEQRLSELESLPCRAIDGNAVLQHGREALLNLPHLMESG